MSEKLYKCKCNSRYTFNYRNKARHEKGKMHKQYIDQYTKSMIEEIEDIEEIEPKKKYEEDDYYFYSSTSDTSDVRMPMKHYDTINDPHDELIFQMDVDNDKEQRRLDAKKQIKEIFKFVFDDFIEDALK